MKFKKFKKSVKSEESFTSFESFKSFKSGSVKRILAALLLSVLAFSFSACGAGKSAADMTPEEKYALAEKMVGESYSALVKQIGEAESSVQSHRCGADGEDHEYTYSGFVVLTYEEGDSEVIEYVEKDS